MPVEIITKEDLNTFKEELLQELRTIISESEQGKAIDNNFLKSSDVRKLLKISTGTLQNLRVNGTLKSNKIGGTLYYSRSDVDKLLK